MEDPSLTRAHREAWARKYRSQPEPWRGPAHLAPLLGLAHDALPARARALEVGAGGGKTLAALPREWRAVGADWAREGIAGVTGAPVVVGDARSLPFRDASFDVVLLVHVLGHLDDGGRRRAVAEAGRVIAPGGVVLVRAFTPADLRAQTGRPLGDGAFEREGIRHGTLDVGAVRTLFRGWRELALAEREAATRFGARRVVVDAAYATTGVVTTPAAP